MTQQDDNPLSKSTGRCETREELKLREVKTRDEMVQVDYRLRALAMNLEQCRSELVRLEGLSLTGLISVLSGNKATRLARIRDQCAEFERQIDTCETELAGLQGEVSEIEQALTLALSSATETESRPGDGVEGPDGMSRMSGDLSAARSVVDILQKAIDAGEEALRDLRGEQETASTLGRCKVVDVRGGLGSMMNVSRRGTGNECASRVRQSLRRFRSQLAAVLAQDHPEGKEELRVVDAELEGMEANFSGHWLASSASGEASADHVERTLVTANMLLEKMMADSRPRVDSCEPQRRSLIENP